MYVHRFPAQEQPLLLCGQVEFGRSESFHSHPGVEVYSYYSSGPISMHMVNTGFLSEALSTKLLYRTLIELKWSLFVEHTVLRCHKHSLPNVYMPGIWSCLVG